MIAGCDVSSFAIDLVLLEDDTDDATWHHYPLTGRTPFERVRTLRAVFPSRSWWEDHGVWLLGIEEPYSQSKGVAKALGLATGAVCALLPADLTVIQTPPQEWKRLTVGKASASKGDVYDWSRDQLGHRFEKWKQDGYDAYAIARAVRLLNNDAADAAERRKA